MAQQDSALIALIVMETWTRQCRPLVSASFCCFVGTLRSKPHVVWQMHRGKRITGVDLSPRAGSMSTCQGCIWLCHRTRTPGLRQKLQQPFHAKIQMLMHENIIYFIYNAQHY